MTASPPALLDPPQWPDRYGPELYHYAYRRVHNADAAAELVQEAFLSALAARASFRGEASERSWLFVILKRKLVDFYRQQARQPLAAAPEADPEEEAPGPLFGPDGHWLPAHAPQPWPAADAALEQQELQQILAACQRRLPPRQQLVFARRFVEEISTEEVCQELALSAANFWVLVHRAKLSLRRCLERHWLGTPPPTSAA
ncbi:sigma-70 family RNA polymerase sigma factor [Hymenobacter ginsengisoli]|uniref:Sigma-70 family RNA polymerase sigma factor n=1 Tax=Hymenobacter ginsengisoli TaxID=1051626 RepID=A0ABP8QJ52_9BACT|nr:MULTISPECIES: sigma-70 family RNA polymerase sigma factor [unclassified Hymenobacter]MBO2033350.1 sigma-70 family RNA polymerase sigma factor [Hymenobacter sp. BT559]